MDKNINVWLRNQTSLNHSSCKVSEGMKKHPESFFIGCIGIVAISSIDQKVGYFLPKTMVLILRRKSTQKVISFWPKYPTPWALEGGEAWALGGCTVALFREKTRPKNPLVPRAVPSLGGLL